MAKASMVKELIVKTENKLGMLEAVTETIAKSGVNITALHAFGVDKDAVFRMTTTDNAKAMGVMKSNKFDAQERDVVAVDLDNNPGTAAEMGKKLKEANIDVKYIYGSTCGSSGACTIIFNSSDNKKAIQILG